MKIPVTTTFFEEKFCDYFGAKAPLGNAVQLRRISHRGTEFTEG